MKINSSRLARKAKFEAIAIAIQEKQAEIDSKVDQAHVVGKAGRRRGWRTSKTLAGEIGRAHTPEDRTWRDAVLCRDRDRCVHCGSRQRLEADHIKPVALYPELRFNVENGRTLCHSCHSKTETYGGKVRRIVSVSTE